MGGNSYVRLFLRRINSVRKTTLARNVPEKKRIILMANKGGEATKVIKSKGNMHRFSVIFLTMRVFENVINIDNNC